MPRRPPCRRHAAAAVLLCTALLLGLPAAAQPPDCADAVRALWPEAEDTPRMARAQPERCAIAPWPGGLRAVAVAPQDDTLIVGLLRGAADLLSAEATGEIVALAIDPLSDPAIAIVPVPLLGLGDAAVGVRLANRHRAEGRSSDSEALHILLHRDDALVPVLAVLLRAELEAEIPCPRGRRPPCRTAWSREWRLEAAGQGRSRPPDLLLRDARTGAVASRHRWTAQGYRPAVFDPVPPTAGPR